MRGYPSPAERNASTPRSSLARQVFDLHHPLRHPPTKSSDVLPPDITERQRKRSHVEAARLERETNAPRRRQRVELHGRLVQQPLQGACSFGVPLRVVSINRQQEFRTEPGDP